MFRALGALGALMVALLASGPPTPAQAAGTADLSLSVSGPPTVQQTTSADFTISYANAGPDTATNLTVALQVPTGLTIDLIQSSGFCTVAVGGQNVTCNVGSVAAGSSGTLPIVVTANTIGNYTIPFSVSSDQTDPSPSDNAVSETLQVVTPTDADLGISFINTNITVRATETAVIQASYGNSGPLAATGVTITFQLGAGLIYEPTGSDARCSPSGQTVTCSIGSLGLGTALLFIDVSAATAATYPVEVSIRGDQPDPTPADNADSFNLQFQPAVAGVGLQFTGTFVRPLVGHPLEVVLHVFNVGPDAATGVLVQVNFPQGWTLDPGPSDPRCTAGFGSSFTCPVAGLAPQASTDIGVWAIPPTPGTFTVTATVTADQFPAGTFNQASTQVPVFTPSADLSVVVSGPFRSVARKTPIDYMVLITNKGPDLAGGVTLTDSWTEQGNQNIELVAANTGQGTCLHKGNGITCTLDDMPAGATAIVTVTITPIGAGTVVDEAVVTSNTPDPNLSNNSATVTTPVT